MLRSFLLQNILQDLFRVKILQFRNFKSISQQHTYKTNPTFSQLIQARAMKQNPPISKRLK